MNLRILTQGSCARLMWAKLPTATLQRYCTFTASRSLKNTPILFRFTCFSTSTLCSIVRSIFYASSKWETSTSKSWQFLIESAMSPMKCIYFHRLRRSSNIKQIRMTRIGLIGSSQGTTLLNRIYCTGSLRSAGRTWHFGLNIFGLVSFASRTLT